MDSDTEGDSLGRHAKPAVNAPLMGELKPGDIIANGLEILELIGQGGMGVVWRVHHREWNRDLAVKMPLPALVGSPTARDRFLREAETWIDLGVHPHIVQCWFVKEISGLPSLFLDFLTGGSLKQWLVAGHVRPGQWKRILEITIQVAEGLAYAHSRGVVHRDVKPANLLIRGDERVCVTDFGIVKTANDKNLANEVLEVEQFPEDMSLTGTGAFLGTPQYGAPEQWGAAEGVDHAADIYALGVTLYEMCCGRRPFDCDQEKTAPEVLIGRHLESKPPDPREFYSDIPSDLAHLTLLCLEKDPKRRPHDMERLKGALKSIYQRLTQQPYKEVGKLPKEQRADTLNNRGVSLHSLAKPKEARDVWRRGLRIESGHPECLFNLTQLELQAARIDSEEALRRLRQAKAGLPLALMCIEEGEFEEAIDTLGKLEPNSALAKSGPTQRALGDAQMYAKQYYAAEKSYRQALANMPADTFSQERKRLASLGKREMAGKILFPSSEPTFQVVISEPEVFTLIDEGSSGILGITATHVIYWDIQDQCVGQRVSRPEGATSVVRAVTAGGLLLCEDKTSFELRRIPSLTLLGRKSGTILAATPHLRMMLVRERNGTFIFNVAKSTLTKVCFPEDAKGPLLAQFDLSGERLCLLLQDGRIGQLDEDSVVTPEEWPEKLDSYQTATSLALNANGSRLYVGHSDGRLQCLNFVLRALDFELSFPRAVSEILTCEQSNKVIAKFEQGFAVIGKNGQILLQGSGPVALDATRGNVLCFPQQRMELFSLSPFRRLRRWAAPETLPVRLVIAADGKRAVSQCKEGAFDVWEVDEEHRVFERSFLLSHGKSFAEIVGASRRFQEYFTAAQESLKRGQSAASYRQLQRARSISGYAQRPEALDLNWQLLDSLRRNTLESVWERVSLESRQADEPRPGPASLLDHGQRLLVSFGSVIELFQDDGNHTTSLWSTQFDAPIVFAEAEPEHGTALVFTQDGKGWTLRLTDGRLSDPIDLSLATLKRLKKTDVGLLFLCRDGRGGLYDLNKGKVIGKISNLISLDSDIHPWQPYTPLISTDGQFFKLDVRARNPKLQHLRLKNYQTNSELTFTGVSEEHGLLYLGFEDGEVLICESVRSTPVFQLGGADGPITGFFLLSSLSVGVASTGFGKLTFWDLQTGERMEEFSAHRGWILSLKTSACGRFLLTTGTDNQVRLWETSWTALEHELEPPLEWLTGQKGPSKLGRFFGFRVK